LTLVLASLSAVRSYVDCVVWASAAEKAKLQKTGTATQLCQGRIGIIFSP
jgi:hypothetical protein